MRGLLRQALRNLRLPLLATDEIAAARAYARFLRQNGIAYAETLDWTRLQIGLWKDSATPSLQLSNAVQSILTAVNPQNGTLLGQRYFPLYSRLKDDFSFTHSEAVGFLSHLRLAQELAQFHSLSAARLTKVLSQLDSRVRFSRQSITTALQQLQLSPELVLGEVQSLCERDREGEVAFFADADLNAAADILQSSADHLGFDGDLGSDLLTLAPEPNAVESIPYIQMLHFQCVLMEYYDHSPLDLYEFRPRGVIADSIFALYPAQLASAGNPFLNNAKSVGTMDRTWVESKKIAVRRGALALFNILAGLEEMSYTGRRELSMLLRAWIFLFLRLSGNQVTQLPAELTVNGLVQLFARMKIGNTQTLGILEQRLLDTLGCISHPQPQWRPRGLADSVNATNISGRKLGDCDFQDVETRRVVAYEAHGGNLTSTYIEEHIRTLRKVVPLRRAELESVADIQNWQATVRFVAHQVSTVVPAAMVIDGLQIAFEVSTFADVLDALIPSEALLVAINENFLPPLRERRTPDVIRNKLLELLGT